MSDDEHFSGIRSHWLVPVTHWGWWPRQEGPSSQDTDPTYGLPPVLTVEETAEFLRLSPKTVYAAVAAREIPARKVRARTVILRDALLDWLRSTRRVLPSKKRSP